MFSQFDLESYKPGDEMIVTKVATFEGTARSGKGTTVEAVSGGLFADGRTVEVIDQGKKFRSLGYLAAEGCVDIADQEQVSAFLRAPSTRGQMIAFMAELQDVEADEERELLYNGRISKASSAIGHNALSHGLAVGLMLDQVAEASGNQVDTVLIDGRALEPYGWRMSREKIAHYVGGFFIECDPLTAARRVLRDFRQLDDMPEADQVALVREAEAIRIRNDNDAKRTVDPLRYPHHAFNLDLLQGLPDEPDALAYTLDKIKETKIVAVNTSHTSSIDQMTDPMVRIVRDALADVDAEIDLWRQFPGRFTNTLNSVIQRIPG